MKKNLFFYAAAAALMLTACTNEDDVVQVNQTVTTVEDGAVGFDVYVPQATTRAGRVNVMTTGTLKNTGFGIFGYQTNDESTSSDPTYANGDLPNYMWNQQVFYNSKAAGWYYAPLKYWPNETNNDSQTPQAGMPNQGSKKYLDRLTFFAYAPWVSANQTTGVASVINSDVEAPNPTGIYRVTGTDGINISEVTSAADPRVTYVVATDPNQSVDLLWGVAPAGGLNYTAVDGKSVKVLEGMPLKDLTKPAVNTNMKFTFQHALARLGVKVVLAADQVAAGGTFDYGNSKVTIEKINITGPFGTTGVLNMNNEHANIAKWKILATENLTIDATHGLAEHLRYDADLNPTSGEKSQQTHTGVTTTLADAIQVSSIKDEYYNDYTTQYAAGELTYSPTTPYFAGPTTNATSSYVPFYNGSYPNTTDQTYFYYFTTNNAATNNKSYTEITLNADAITYPNALVFENICHTATANIVQIDGTSRTKEAYRAHIAYRKVGNTYTPTGQVPEIGDYVFVVGGVSSGADVHPCDAPISAPTQDAVRYTAKPNYFMVIPTQTSTTPSVSEDSRTLKVKITYYVSTTDPNIADKVVYTKNEVEKDVVLPHLKNGVAYNLKLILGLTSVKVEAEVADWVTTEGEVNLPQNTSE